MISRMMPGAVLGGRYRLEDLLEDLDGARFWRAIDTVLARDVAVHVLDESDPRVDAVLEAARVSATVTDPHLLRVLDADARDGLAWVINEWGTGQSLDVMVSRQTLAPDRAAWLVREAAAGVAVAHAKGVAHGRLAPENVMLTEAGTVRLIGFAVDAALRESRLRTGNYPAADPLQADVLDLAGLLYAGLVARWPGASWSAVAQAPRDARGPLRPRQVRAGVPRALDAICDRMLGRALPGRTAHQLAAVLTEYLGELATTDPALLPGLGGGPVTPAISASVPEEVPGQVPDGVPDQVPGASRGEARAAASEGRPDEPPEASPGAVDQPAVAADPPFADQREAGDQAAHQEPDEAADEAAAPPVDRDADRDADRAGDRAGDQAGDRAGDQPEVGAAADHPEAQDSPLDSAPSDRPDLIADLDSAPIPPLAAPLPAPAGDEAKPTAPAPPEPGEEADQPEALEPVPREPEPADPEPGGPDGVDPESFEPERGEPEPIDPEPFSSRTGGFADPAAADPDGADTAGHRSPAQAPDRETADDLPAPLDDDVPWDPYRDDPADNPVDEPYTGPDTEPHAGPDTDPEADPEADPDTDPDTDRGSEEGVSAQAPGEPPEETAYWAIPPTGPQTGPATGPDPDATALIARDRPGSAAGASDAASESADPEATAQSTPEELLGDADATQLAGYGAGEDEDDDWHRPRQDPAPPAPILEPLPERPLFAPEGTIRTPKGPVRRSVTEDWATEQPPDAEAGWAASRQESRTETTGDINWPFGEDPEEEPEGWEERSNRHWLRLPLIMLVLATAAVAVAIYLAIGREPASKDTGSARSPSPHATSTAVASGTELKVAGVKDFDPFGDPPEENPQDAPKAIDKDPATAWTTVTYRGRPTLGGLKPGVGLVVDLGSVQSVGSVALELVGRPTSLELYAAPTSSSAPTGLDGLHRIAEKQRAGEQVKLEPSRAVRTRYVVVWLTSLPPVDGGFRGGISEITVRR